MHPGRSAANSMLPTYCLHAQSVMYDILSIMPHSTVYTVQAIPSDNVTVSCALVVQNGLFLRVDNFATVNGRKAYDMSEVSEFCLEKYRPTICMSMY